MFICSCRAITESQVKGVAAACMDVPDSHPETVALALGLDDPDCCGRCIRNLDRIALICLEVREEDFRAPALAVR